MRLKNLTLLLLLTSCGDPDGDGLSSSDEKAIGTDPLVADTDSDGLSDGEEHLTTHTDPLVADTDSDGLADGAELDAGTDPLVADTDADGIMDGAEVDAGTDPLDADSDDDGLDDGEEHDLGTDPLDADSDDDGLTDSEEVDAGTDALDADSDDDGYLDGWEVTEGSDPMDPLSVIYTGGWPYNPDKDALNGKSLADAPIPAVGLDFARLRLEDQHGDQVDLFDFMQDDKPVAVAIIEANGFHSNNLGNMVTTGDTFGYGDYYHNVHANVVAGKLHWIYVMSMGRPNQDPTRDDVAFWLRRYPQDISPVLLGNVAIRDKYAPEGMPVVYLLSPTAKFTNLPDNTEAATHALQAVDEL